MNRRVLTLLPVLLGGAAGALFGLFEAFPKSPASSADATAALKAQRPAAAIASSAPAVAATVVQPEPAQGASAAKVGTLGAGSALPAASAKAADSAGAARTPPPAKRAFDLSEPTSQENLLAAQIQCNRASPEECERAALGLDSGALGTKDPPRARSLRRIALTLYVKQCETGRALACARLAEMYEVGDIVQVNPRNAQALRARVTELCAQRGASEPGCSP